MLRKVPTQGAAVRSIAFILSAASSVALLTSSGGCGSDDLLAGRDATADTNVVLSLEKRGLDLSESTPLVFQTLGEAGARPGEYLLELEVTSRSTSWDEADNESVYLAITSGTRLLAHVPLHQGETRFLYRSLVGKLFAGEAVSIAMASFSGSKGTAPLWVERATIIRIDDGDEALLNAPAFVWPREKRFDDLPVALGGSRVKKEYTVVYTHENRGTVTLCGGGAKGLQAEIARWGRSLALETIYRYGSDRGFLRCTGFTNTADVMFDEKHPRLYYGGHNRLFENRKGYGVTCGGEKAEKTDGPFVGWGETAADKSDDDTTVLLRPVPEGMDTLGYAAYSGRREALVDRLFPWAYRLSSLEAERELSLTAPFTYPMDQYLYVDLHFRDVEGAGDGICTQVTSGGFVISAVLQDGTVLPGLRVTQSYGSTGDVWKRLAIALPNKIAPADFVSLRIEAQETEAFTLEELGRVFLVDPAGSNGASINALREDPKPVELYFDAAKTGCFADEKDDDAGRTLSCIGTSATLTIR